MDPANVLLRINEVAAVGGGAVATDIPAEMLSHFVDLAMKARELPLQKLDFVPEAWDNIHPDIAGIYATVDEMTAPVTPSPAP